MVSSFQGTADIQRPAAGFDLPEHRISVIVKTMSTSLPSASQKLADKLSYCGLPWILSIFARIP
jgi:hypothetical protein